MISFRVAPKLNEVRNFEGIIAVIYLFIFCFWNCNVVCAFVDLLVKNFQKNILSTKIKNSREISNSIAPLFSILVFNLIISALVHACYPNG